MRFAILGNSGSGKSTLARWLAEQTKSPLLDLDTIAWVQDELAVPRPIEDAVRDLRSFCESNSSWIVEGCYSNLIGETFAFEPTLLFLNPGEDVCLANCELRPWEPHKFKSKNEQDKHLMFLMKWVSEYYVRDGVMSLKGHRRCFDEYGGSKVELNSKLDFESPSEEVLALIR